MSIGDLQKYIPITVIFAVFLFIAKEIIELLRRYKADKRKKRAICLILAQEIQRNHWALISFFWLLDTLTYSFKNNPQAQYRLHIAYDGSEHLRMKENPSNSFESGQAIPSFVDDNYKCLLPQIAELDEGLFKLLNDTYYKLADLEHFRKTVVEYLAGGDTAPPDGTKEFFIPKLSKEKNEYLGPMNKAYIALTGAPLKEKEFRLR